MDVRCAVYVRVCSNKGSNVDSLLNNLNNYILNIISSLEYDLLL